jgi:hypothetical protein
MNTTWSGAGLRIRIDLMRIRIRIRIQHFFLIADLGLVT